MAIYRSNEVRKMSAKERGEKLDELRAELLREHGVKAAGGAPKNPGRIRALRKTIARILTISAAGEAPEAAPPRTRPPSPRPQARPPSPAKVPGGKRGPAAKPAKKAATGQKRGAASRKGTAVPRRKT